MGGLVGARIYHVLDYHTYYAEHPVKIIAFWDGGIGIWGGIIGGFITLWVISKIKKLTLPFWTDLFATVLPLGQAIGRWGNYVNQENFGYPTSLPWGMFIEQKNRPILYESFTHFHPLFLYESILNLTLFLILLRNRAKWQSGQGVTTLYYLMGYSLLRFSLDFLRLEQWYAGPFVVSQMISVIIFATALGCLYKLKRSDKVFN